ncbi:MAG TPA: methyltransferase domain-containing protein [Dehalococcoidia bacterium]|nr:methyltransferase domain-containing protein [Dehalococcoidia bacterium]
MTQEAASFEPFAEEVAYIRVNEKLVERLLRRLNHCPTIKLLDIAAGTGLLTSIAYERAKAAGAKLISTLLDLDFPALVQARLDVRADKADFVYASADYIPLRQDYDAVIFANSIHLLDDNAKRKALAETWRVLRPGGVLAVNTTFYEGAYPEGSKAFYSRWIRRALVEINQRLPRRKKLEKAQAMDWLSAENYRSLIGAAGFKVLEMRERRVRLSQAAVRAISAYREFAKGALHATDDDAVEASRALQATVQQTFRELKMKYLPRSWLEIVAVKASS